MAADSGPDGSRADEDPDRGDHLSGLHGLLVLAMRMAERDDEAGILELVTAAVPSLARCRLGGIFLVDHGWRATSGPCERGEVRDDLQLRFADLPDAGGALVIPGEIWAWALPLRSRTSYLGNLVVSAGATPTASEMFVLTVLGQQTGTAVANARLHVRERATTAELRAANAALADSLHALERGTQIRRRLTRAAAEGGGEAAIARVVHELTGRGVAVEDPHGNLRAWAGPGSPGRHPTRTKAAREALLRSGLNGAGPIRDGDRLIAVAGTRDEVLGVLVLVDPDGGDDGAELVALEHGATVLALELVRLRGLAESELRLGRDIVQDLLDGRDPAGALVRARALGHDLEPPHHVVVVEDRARGHDAGPFIDAVRRAVRLSGIGTLLVTRGGDVVVLALADSSWGGLHAAVRRETPGSRVRLGVGGSCARPGGFPRSYREARFALKMQDTAGSDAGVTVFDDLGIYRILADAGDLERVESFARHWLGDLLDYDATRPADMVLTLRRYLELGGSHAATADALAVHRSTLKYRLRRIGEISGHDLGDPEISFNLQLAARAWHTLGAIRADSGPA